MVIINCMLHFNLLQLIRYIAKCEPGQILSYVIIDHTLQGRVNSQCVDYLGE